MEEKYTNVNGHRIRYLEGGKAGIAPGHDAGDAEHRNDGTVILLHGLGASAERWSGVWPILEKRYRVLVPDMIGFGLSDKPQVEYTPEFFSEFLDGFIRTTCNRRVCLVGSSLGGLVAVYYTAVHPASVHKLVLVSPAGMIRRPTSAFNLYMRAAMYPSVSTAAEAFEAMEASGEKTDANLVEGFVTRMKMPNSKYTFMSAILGMKNAPRLSSMLQAINNHTLVIWGSEDPVIPIRYGGYFASAIRNCTFFRMSKCGHTPYVQQPEVFTDKLIEFFTYNH